MDHFIPIERACAKLGSLTALARALSVAPSTVHQWLVGARPVPPKRCSAIERATLGEVSRKDLRPIDWADFWPELDRNEAPSSSACQSNRAPADNQEAA
ncbi:helix-turn-helix domain-containing protein [Burkholderia glumae]|uniref:transcriptional regulator n=1 Tax=Burkholderia glumae TaxID=337 RepID=UPI0020371B60|nr:helix-turn-helix domain-containing protein [Burkholderia glumae]MCM2537685.1 helix-turn-helix domain-containing protein [Burkholderia glumae]